MDSFNLRQAAAFRALSFWLDRVERPLELLRNGVADPHPRVRVEAVRALSFMRGEAEAAEVALEVLNQEVDDYLQYTLDETMRSLEQK